MNYRIVHRISFSSIGNCWIISNHIKRYLIRCITMNLWATRYNTRDRR